jgi:hypothetical protein
MEARTHSGIARLVQQSLGSSALFPSYVFVTGIDVCNKMCCTQAIQLIMHFFRNTGRHA